MKTSIIGGGKGCQAILEMVAQGRLKKLNLEIKCIIDPHSESPGMKLAEKQGITISHDLKDAFRVPGLELIIEMTGKDEILNDIYQLIPPGVRVIDHKMALVFWDLDIAEQNLRHELHEKEELEIQSKKDKQELQVILDSIPEIVMVMDTSRRIERVNARFATVTGLSSEEAHGKYCRDVFCRNKEDRIVCDTHCPFTTVMKTGDRSSMIQSRKRRDDSDGFYEVTANPIYDKDGEIMKIVETSHPITEQVLMRREAEESERRFRSFINMAQDLITIQDNEGKYMVVNPKAASFFGLQPEDFIGRTGRDVLSPQIAELFAMHNKQVMMGQGYLSFEEKVVIKGRELYLSSIRFPLQNFKGDIIGICNIARDISNEKDLQQELVNTEKMAAMGKLAAGVAHEINNPLTGIVTFAEALMDEAPKDDPLISDYKLIYDEAMRCRQIVKDLLEFSRMEKPKRQLKNINQLIQKAISLVANQASFQNINFNLNLLHEIPSVSIDSNQIQQVILNLIINAAEAMDYHGSITIETERRNEMSSVGVAIVDEGSGISPDNIKRIFEPFFTTKGVKGNGLGLAAVHSILEQHSGNIGVDSEVGRGTTFVFTLPYPEELYHT